MARPRVLVSVSCWLVVAVLLARIAYGGDPLGIIYVLRTGPPLMLVGGALALVAATGLVVDWRRNASRGSAMRSVVAALAIVPFSIWLVSIDHRSGWAIALAAGIGGLVALPTAVGRVRDR